MMRNLSLAAMTIAALIAAGSSAYAGSITYNVVPYPAYQNGYQLSGTITTDGTIGALSASSFLSWSLTISNATETYAISSADLQLVYLQGEVEATSTTIYLPATNLQEYDTNVLVLYGGNQHRIEWDTLQFTGLPNSYYLAKKGIGNNILWEKFFTTIGPAYTIAAVGSVPEPSSSASLVAAMVCIGAAAIRRRTLTRV